jgi:hypothetical protein
MCGSHQSREGECEDHAHDGVAAFQSGSLDGSFAAGKPPALAIPSAAAKRGRHMAKVRFFPHNGRHELYGASIAKGSPTISIVM